MPDKASMLVWFNGESKVHKFESVAELAAALTVAAHEALAFPNTTTIELKYQLLMIEGGKDPKVILVMFPGSDEQYEQPGITSPYQAILMATYSLLTNFGESENYNNLLVSKWNDMNVVVRG